MTRAWEGDSTRENPLIETPVGFEPDLFSGGDASHRTTVERVVVDMREPVDETLSLRAMAEIAHLSPYHLAHTFR